MAWTGPRQGRARAFSLSQRLRGTAGAFHQCFEARHASSVFALAVVSGISAVLPIAIWPQ
jgi:hypothetical protein